MKIKIKVVDAVPAGNLNFRGHTPVIDGIKHPAWPQVTEMSYTMGQLPIPMTLMESVTNIFKRRKK